KYRLRAVQGFPGAPHAFRCGHLRYRECRQCQPPARHGRNHHRAADEDQRRQRRPLQDYRNSSLTIMSSYIGAIDQGTTSTRFIVFDRAGRVVACAQREHEQIYPQPGWVEHDPEEIWRRTQEVIREALDQRGLRAADLAAIGVTNQRETTIVWDRHSGQPVYN